MLVERLTRGPRLVSDGRFTASLSNQKLLLPKFALPQLTALNADLTRAVERWQSVLAPIDEASKRLRRQIEGFTKITSVNLPELRWIEEQERILTRFEAAGWLPHRSSPQEIADRQAEATPEALSHDIELHYAAEWEAVSASLREDIARCDFDDEAKGCFNEALAAHGAGYYRCSPRLLFPEIERVARIELHGGAFSQMASQRDLVEAIGRLTPHDFATTGIMGMYFYRKLTDHLYAPVKNDQARAAAQSEAIPNRHAAVHGLVSYTTAKSSLNAIFVADYLLQAISTIKRLARPS